MNDTIPGILRLPTEVQALEPAALMWSDYLCNRVLILLAIVWLLIRISEMSKIVPQILFSISRARGSAGFEYNMSLARMRNIFTLSAVLPFCLVASRFDLYPASFIEAISPEWRTLALIVIMMAYALIRSLCFRLIRLRKLDNSYKAAIARGSYGFLIFLVVVMLLSVAILMFIRLPDNTISTVLHIEILLFYTLSILRSAQILHLSYRALPSFLYLCALEFLPAAMLIASAVFC